jgi:hypothetical protein
LAVDKPAKIFFIPNAMGASVASTHPPARLDFDRTAFVRGDEKKRTTQYPQGLIIQHASWQAVNLHPQQSRFLNPLMSFAKNDR